MFEKVAMVDEISYIRCAKIHAQGDAGERMMRIAVPERYFDHVHHLSLNRPDGMAAIDREIILRQNQKVQLVKMKFMVLAGTILNLLILH